MTELERKLSKELEEVRSQLNELQTMYDSLVEQIHSANRNRYGKKSEAVFSEQLSLFDEAEYISEEKINEEETITIAEHTRKKKKKNDYSKLPVETYDHDIEDKHCPTCGNELTELKPTIKDVLRYVPGRYVVERHIIHQYTCKRCSEEDTMVVYSGENYPKLIDKSLLSPSLAAHIITSKFVQAIPLYRQEQEYKRQGIPISRQNMSDWLLKVSEVYMKPLYNLMEEKLLTYDILYGDETTVNCLEEKDRQKSYMWFRGNSPTEKEQIRLYSYNASRDEDYCKELYKGYHGYLECDGYQTYRKIPGVIVVGCWAHGRRYVYEALVDTPIHKEYQKVSNKQEFLKKHPAYAKILEVFQMIEDLFKYEKQYQKEGLTHKEIYERRQIEAKKKLEEIKEYIDNNQSSFLPYGKNGKAIEYLRNNWEYLTNYIADGRLEITNNLAERSIKPFVIGRKNWLFASTAKGAKSSAILYSIIETAKANKLKPYEYLTYILEEMRTIDIQDKEAMKKLLPYSKELPSNLKTPMK